MPLKTRHSLLNLNQTQIWGFPKKRLISSNGAVQKRASQRTPGRSRNDRFSGWVRTPGLSIRQVNRRKTYKSNQRRQSRSQGVKVSRSRASRKCSMSGQTKVKARQSWLRRLVTFRRLGRRCTSQRRKWGTLNLLAECWCNQDRQASTKASSSAPVATLSSCPYNLQSKSHKKTSLAIGAIL